MFEKIAATPAFTNESVSIPRPLKVLIYFENDKLLTSVSAVVIVVLAVAPVTMLPFCCKFSVTTPAAGAVKVAVTVTSSPKKLDWFITETTANVMTCVSRRTIACKIP